MNWTLARAVLDHLGFQVIAAWNQHLGDDIERFLTCVARAPVRIGLATGFGWCFVAGILYSWFEQDASVIDGWYWATVVMPTVGFGDFAPHTIPGRWLYEFTWVAGKFSEALVMGAFAAAIVQRRIRPHYSTTPELDDDFEDLRAVVDERLERIQALTNHPRVKQALRDAHNEGTTP